MGAWAASARAIAPGSSKASGSSSPGTPPQCANSCPTVTSPLPPAANSGQSSLTRASSWSSPRSTSNRRAVATAPLRAGEDDGCRPLAPRAPGLAVGKAAPEVDEQLPLDHRGECAACLDAARQVVLEDLEHALE